MAANTFFNHTALPWQMVKSPSQQWKENPTFLIGEYLFIGLTVLGFIHASSTARTSITNLLIFIASLIAGTSNDVFFMALPIVNNFWQSQATLMITPRLPVYIPCVYISFMYFPAVAARHFVAMRRFGSPLERKLLLAAVSGLFSCAFYSPYDVIGGKFVWWSWHDTDAPIRDRALGVAPYSSTLWTLTFCGTFSWLLDMCIEKIELKQQQGREQSTARVAATDQNNNNSSSSISKRKKRQPEPKSVSAVSAANASASAFSPIARRLFAALPHLWPVALFSTPIMMVQMAFSQPLEPARAHGLIALTATLIFYGSVAIRGILVSTSSGAAAPPSSSLLSLSSRKTLAGAIVFYTLTLCALAVLFDPSAVVSSGVHQLTGQCGVEAVDISGNTRHVFLCVDNFDETYDFHCLPPSAKLPKHGSEWYTICGKPHDATLNFGYSQFVFAVTMRSVITVVLTMLTLF